MSKQAILSWLGLLAPGINQNPRATVWVRANRNVSKADFVSGRAKITHVTVAADGHVFAHVVA